MAVVSAMGVLLAGAIVHCILVCVHRLRGFVHEKICGKKYRTVSSSNTIASDLAQMEAQCEEKISPLSLLTY